MWLFRHDVYTEPDTPLATDSFEIDEISFRKDDTRSAKFFAPVSGAGLGGLLSLVQLEFRGHWVVTGTEACATFGVLQNEAICG